MDIRCVPLLAATLAAVTLSGCVSNKLKPNDQYASLPPRLIIDDQNQVGWDRPSAFGPVPAQLQARGDYFCFTSARKLAVGYHPYAMNLQGQRFEGGGFLCSR